MKKSATLILILLACYITLPAQTLYMPRDIKQAYAKGTRAADGKPGKNYWQNYGRYNIQVTVNPPDRTVTGTEQIMYVNNSPDTLKQLNIKLIINIHRPGAARYKSLSGTDYLTPGMQIDNFTANQKTVKWDNYAASGTNHMIDLPAVLLPHDSVKLDVAFHYEVSKQSGREGAIDPTTYFLAYFYPRVAVYDDYNGWDGYDFVDRQEFYNDFNDYTLKVTVPKNYIVWATGTLQNPEQVLQPQYIKRLQASYTSDSTIYVATTQDMLSKQVTTQNATNTWVWKANHISDMTVGLSDHYVWDAASVLVDDATRRRASVQAAFADSAKDFHHSVQYARHSLDFFSHKWPGVPYPFPKMTAFQGFADMEFPMMVNDEHVDDLPEAELLQDHEIAHTYFPFYMGINESRYAFMDEGWATTLELFINATEVGKQQAEKNYKASRINGWIHDNATIEDLPIITPSSELTSTGETRAGYGHNSYGKPSLSYLALKDMLGDVLFAKCLHEYMNRWNGKHPIPWDYFNAMSNASGQNLNWFFNNWFFTNDYIDLAISKVTKTGIGYQVEINNIGGFAVPFDMLLTYADGTTGTLHQTPAVWKADQKKVVIGLKNSKTITGIKIDGGVFMDANEKDNVWNRK